MGEQKEKGKEEFPPAGARLRPVDQKERRDHHHGQAGKGEEAGDPDFSGENAVAALGLPRLQGQHPLQKSEDLEEEGAAHEGIRPKERGQESAGGEEGKAMKRGEEGGGKRGNPHGTQT
jgi:hypothetical protein